MNTIARSVAKLASLALLAVTSTVCVAACSSSNSPQAQEAAPPTAPSLSGTWKSACTPMNAQQGFSLTFDLATSTWGLDYAVFADTACTTPFFTVRIEGPYEVGAPSATVPGANDARFAFTKKTITPHMDAAAQFLSSAQGCNRAGFAVSQASDLTELGCAGLGQYPKSKCAADYDVVAVSGDVIRFGERPADNDMCTEDKRPKALSQLGSKRVR